MPDSRATILFKCFILLGPVINTREPSLSLYDATGYGRLIFAYGSALSPTRDTALHCCRLSSAVQFYILFFLFQCRKARTLMLLFSTVRNLSKKCEQRTHDSTTATKWNQKKKNEKKVQSKQSADTVAIRAMTTTQNIYSIKWIYRTNRMKCSA